LPAGTVHAVGGGVLMAEVQQTSDATFRLFDWNRRDRDGKSRTLHVEEALACIDWKQGPVTPVHAAPFAGEPDNCFYQSLVACPSFDLDYVQSGEAFWCGFGKLQVLIVLRGQGRLTGPGGEEELRVGQTWLLPASLPRCRCRPEGTLSCLLCTLPD